MAHWATYVAAHMGMLIDNFETWVGLMVLGPADPASSVFRNASPERPRP